MYIEQLVRYVETAVQHLYAAARPLLAPYLLMKRVVSLGDLRRLCEREGALTLTYTISGLKIVRAKLGTLTESAIPSKITVNKMPPLKPFVEAKIVRTLGTGLEVLDWDRYVTIIRETKIGDLLNKILELASKGRKFVYLAELISDDTNQKETAYLLIILRLLFPGIIELYTKSGLDLNTILQQISSIKISNVVDFVTRINDLDLIAELIQSLTNQVHVVAHASRKVQAQSERSCIIGHSAVKARSHLPGSSIVHPVTLYRIPKLMNYVDFRGKVIVDVGCGFGTKGAYAIKRGARLVVYIDVDKSFFKLRASGTHTERVVADARCLPLRMKSADIAILWNVVQFIPEKDSVLEEVRRATRELVLFSVYNAKTAVWKYGFKLFLKDCRILGRPTIVTCYKQRQYMAIVDLSKEQKSALELSTTSTRGIITGLHLLRMHYCFRCRIRAPRSTGVRLLEKYLDKYDIRPRIILDYGCINWRNSKYLQAKYGCETIRVDVMPETKPDVVAYPTHLPFRPSAFDTVLLTHVLMFLRDNREMAIAIQQAAKLAPLVVIECYHTKRVPCLNYTTEELEDMLCRHFVILRKKVVARLHECYLCASRLMQR